MGPLWLKKGVYLLSFYLLVFLVVTAFVRVILWGILWHFGIEFWLFPNYFIDSNDPRDSFWPLYSFEVREDQTSSAAIILRLFSGILLVYLGFQFLQDEKNLEDLAELRDHGLHDLFEYGQEFVLGNALGDGSKKNSTFNQRTETFTEKYKKQLAKDLDEIENDEDENANSTEAASEESEPAGESINLDDLMNADDDEEEEASAKGSDEKQDK